MLIAKIQNNTVVEVADYRSLFPNTSFGSNGPDAQFLEQNSCMTVTVFKPYDAATQKLVPADPYIEDNTVYTVQVESLTEEEIAAQEASKKAKVKAQAMQLLTETDWTQMPDVDLVNKADFTAYRAELRVIALNPPVEVTEWPEKPEEIWSV
jgi:Phage tail assembly chaperone protein